MLSLANIPYINFKHIDRIFASIAKALKSGGYFIVNEYVGPSRFQWTDRQLAAINGTLALLPLSYRRRWSDGTIKSKVHRPSLLRMRFSDPSEAIESSAIRDALYKHFHVVEVSEYGGAILHMLLADIAMNFLSEDEKTRSLLSLCFQIEDTLMSIGDIRSDFIVAICRKGSQ